MICKWCNKMIKANQNVVSTAAAKFYHTRCFTALSKEKWKE